MTLHATQPVGDAILKHEPYAHGMGDLLQRVEEEVGRHVGIPEFYLNIGDLADGEPISTLPDDDELLARIS